MHLEIYLELTYPTIVKYPEFFFDTLKTGQNEKPYVFQEISIPEIYVQLFENSKNLIALQVSCIAFTKNFEWLANGTVLGQNSLNSSWGKICKKILKYKE